MDEWESLGGGLASRPAVATWASDEMQVFFIGADGQRHSVWGWQPYSAYRDAALAAGASPVNEGPLEPLAAIERFGPIATAEAEMLSGRPRPLVEAELWGLATEWKLKPVTVLTGTIWEQA